MKCMDSDPGKTFAIVDSNCEMPGEKEEAFVAVSCSCSTSTKICLVNI